MTWYFVAAGVSLVAVLGLTPVARVVARRFGAIDVPEDRKVHEKDTPTLGGLAIYLGILLGTGVFVLFSSQSYVRSDLLGIMMGATIVFIFGAIDDIHTLGPLPKLFGQILAAGVLVIMGVQIEMLHIPWVGVISLSPELSAVISIIWVVAFINIINLIDGLDGLAAGITFITAVSMFIYVVKSGGGTASTNAALISIVLAGATLGFLVYNFYPASIFMGDSGSMLLGFLLGAVTIQGVLKSIAAVALVIPLLALAIPILDTGMAIARRALRGKPITHADKEHIHHRLLNIGHTQWQAVLILYLWTALLCGTSLALKFYSAGKVYWIILVIAIGIFALTAFPRLVKGDNGKGKHRAKRRRSKEREADEVGGAD